MKRKYYNCELKELDAQKLKAKLKEEGIEFESSGVGWHYTHFKFCAMTQKWESLITF